MSILRHLLNAPPIPNAQYITDKRGHKYWLEWQQDKELSTLLLSYRGRYVAHVYLQWERPIVFLVDIVIDKPTFRGQGIGTALLEYVIAYLKREGIERVSGWIAKHDAEANPNLIVWYQEHGFQVIPSQNSHWAAEAHLDLKPRIDDNEDSA